MRMFIILAALMVAGVHTATAGYHYSVHVETEKYGNSTASYDDAARRARMMSLDITAVNYRFEIRASSLAPDSAQLEWIVLARDSKRQIEEVARGTASLSFSKAQRRTTLETGRVQIPDTGEGAHQSDLYGYGIRITDDQGRVLEEKYSPAGAKSAITWTPSANAPPPAPPRPTVSMPVVF